MRTPNIPNYLLYFRDEFALSSWILVGACLQSMLTYFVPLRLAVLPALLTLIGRLVHVTLQAQGLLHNPRAKDVIRGKHTAQIPNDDGTFPSKPGDKDIVIFILATRVSHPKGRFAPGVEDITNYFRNMWQDLGRNREKWGYLGKTPTLISTEEDYGNTLVWISYWKSVDHLHTFARGESHQTGWSWYDKTANQKYPWIGIQHELYYAPRGHWENITHNAKPFMLATTSHVVHDGLESESSHLASAVQQVQGPTWRSMKSRLGLYNKSVPGEM